MTRPTPSSVARRGRSTPRIVARIVGLALAAAAIGVAVPSTDAVAGGRVTAVSDLGPSRASATGPTTFSVSGSGFQSIPGGFGGIYVLFGWVDDPSGGWAPSRGGATGDTFAYVPDSEDRDNQGYQRFVAFPGSQTSASANGGEIAADGSWSTTLVVPGPTFEAQDRSGAPMGIDCTRVTCGIITVGAHGVANATNETFTAIEFASGTGANDETSARGSTGTNAEPGSEDPSEAGTEPGAEEVTMPTEATVGIDQETAVQGRVLAFAGRGFLPGEQVLALLDDGVAAVGPMSAGASGEIAGVLQLPADTKVGTHTLRLTATASGQEPVAEFTVRADPVAVAALEAVAPPPNGPGAYVWAGAGILALTVVVTWIVASRIRSHRASRRGVAAEATA